MTTALNAAKFLLLLDDPESGDLTSNLKLQKLLYYAQGVHLALYDEPLFSDRIEAWQHGPVCPVVYREYKQFGAGPIPCPEEFDVRTMEPRDAETLKEVHTVYGQFSAWRLRELSHCDGGPWKMVYREDALAVEIPKETMRLYFKDQVVSGQT